MAPSSGSVAIAFLNRFGQASQGKPPELAIFASSILFFPPENIIMQADFADRIMQLASWCAE
ncbi:hypothetical protein KCP70_19255 [Salmonella enterica subsp. enterica]|nr:hypothetical protein KCP70_19255 [Salmonella enterica subsp. enterica]